MTREQYKARDEQTGISFKFDQLKQQPPLVPSNRQSLRILLPALVRRTPLASSFPLNFASSFIVALKILQNDKWMGACCADPPGMYPPASCNGRFGSCPIQPFNAIHPAPLGQSGAGCVSFAPSPNPSMQPCWQTCSLNRATCRISNCLMSR